MRGRTSLTQELIQKQQRERRNRAAALHEQEQAQKKIEEEISSLHEAVRLGYPSAVKRLLTNTNVNAIDKGKSPFALVKEGILKENDRKKLRAYYDILFALINAGADTSEITEKERHMIYYLTPVILYKTPLPRSVPSGINPPAHHNTPAKFAIEVFDEAHNNFNIRELQQIPYKDLEEYLYEDEDFTVEISSNSSWAGRAEMGVKMGNIYIQYAPTGKGSYSASIYSIDKKAHQLTLLQAFDGERNSGIDFDAIVPFDLSSFYMDMTNALGSADLKTFREAYSSSYDVKMNLIDSALGKQKPAFYIVTSLKQEENVLNSRHVIDVVQDKDDIDKLFYGKTLTLKKNEGYVVYKITDPSAVMPPKGSAIDLSQYEQVEIGLYSPVTKNEIDFKPFPIYTSGQSFLGSQLGSIRGSMISVKKSAQRNQVKREAPPAEFYCIINSGEIMKDPVTTTAGQTYEREAIESWFNTCRKNGRKITDPATGVELKNPTLIPNRNLQDAIQQWQIRQPAVPQPPKKSPSLLSSLRNASVLSGEARRPTLSTSIFSQLKKEQEKLRNPQKEPAKQHLALNEKGKEKEKEKGAEETHETAHQNAEEETPLAFECPISGEIMHDPVMTPNGDSYEREAIVGWLKKEQTDPQTRARVSVDDLVKNYALRSVIDNWEKTHAAKHDEGPEKLGL